MTDDQAGKLINILATQAVVLHGIMNLLQASNIQSGAQAGAIQFKDLQKIIDATAASIKIPS